MAQSSWLPWMTAADVQRNAGIPVGQPGSKVPMQGLQSGQPATAQPAAPPTSFNFPAFMPGQQELMAQSLSMGFGAPYQQNYQALGAMYGPTTIKATGTKWIDSLLGVSPGKDAKKTTMTYDEWIEKEVRPNRGKWPNTWDDPDFRKEYERLFGGGQTAAPAQSPGPAMSAAGPAYGLGGQPYSAASQGLLGANLLKRDMPEPKLSGNRADLSGYQPFQFMNPGDLGGYRPQEKSIFPADLSGYRAVDNFIPPASYSGPRYLYTEYHGLNGSNEGPIMVPGGPFYYR